MVRAVYSPEPDLGKVVVRTLSAVLSRLVLKIYWLDFDEILYIVYWYGPVVPPLTVLGNISPATVIAVVCICAICIFIILSQINVDR